MPTTATAPPVAVTTTLPTPVRLSPATKVIAPDVEVLPEEPLVELVPLASEVPLPSTVMVSVQPSTEPLAASAATRM